MHEERHANSRDETAHGFRDLEQVVVPDRGDCHGRGLSRLRRERLCFDILQESVVVLVADLRCGLYARGSGRGEQEVSQWNTASMRPS